MMHTCACSDSSRARYPRVQEYRCYRGRRGTHMVRKGSASEESTHILSSMGGEGGQTNEHEAVTLYHARRIHTMASDEPEALAVRGERIMATGKLDMLRERFPRADVVEY